MACGSGLGPEHNPGPRILYARTRFAATVRHTVRDMDMDHAIAIHEVAAALERADASARVLGARGLAARVGVGPTAAFSALADAGPDGLVPPVGTGGALTARHLERAALAAATAGDSLPAEVTDALSHAVLVARGQAGGARALDPCGVAVAVRREVAAVRGLAEHSMMRDAAWQHVRLGTFLPRAAWMTALLLACTTVAADDPEAADATWHAAALVAGIPPGQSGGRPVGVLSVLLVDARFPMSVAHAVDEVAASLFDLSRRGEIASGPLALARATSARLGSPALHRSLESDPAGAIGEALDAIGAIAASTSPRAAGAPAPRLTPV